LNYLKNVRRITGSLSINFPNENSYNLTSLSFLGNVRRIDNKGGNYYVIMIRGVSKK